MNILRLLYYVFWAAILAFVVITKGRQRGRMSIRNILWVKMKHRDITYLFPSISESGLQINMVVQFKAEDLNLGE